MTSTPSLIGPIIQLSGVDPFRGLSHRQLSAVALETAEVLVEADSWLVAPGDPVKALFVIVDGVARRRPAPDRSLGAGALVGFPEVLEGSRARSGVQAETDVIALRLATDELRDLCERDFGFLSSLLVHLAQHVDDDPASYERVVSGPPETFTDLPPGVLDRVSRMLALYRAVTLPVDSMDALAELAGRVDQRAVESGEVLWASGSRADAFHIVARGALSMSRIDGGTMTLGAGALPGFPEALADRPHRRELRAIEPSTLLTVTSDSFLDLLEDHFELAFSVLAALAGRAVAPERS